GRILPQAGPGGLRARREGIPRLRAEEIPRIRSGQDLAGRRARQDQRPLTPPGARAGARPSFLDRPGGSSGAMRYRAIYGWLERRAENVLALMLAAMFVAF